MSVARIIFISVILKISSEANDDLKDMCPHIQKGFMEGMKSFEFDDQKGKFLADNGFTGKKDDVSFSLC